MRVWIDRNLMDLIDEDIPHKVLSSERIKDIFLTEALPGDMALLPFEDDYLDFLTEKKRRGLNNPVIFISTEPTLIQENLPSYNALLIDLKRMCKKDVKNIVRLIFRLCSEAGRPVPPVSKEMVTEELQRDKPEESPENIRKVINYLINEGVSIIISFPILEGERPVTVRGSCRIKEIIDDKLLFLRFRPVTILKGIKKDMIIKAVFPAKTSYEGTLKVLKVNDDEVLATIPDRLFIERRRFLRIEPSPERPVNLYILKHDEPTIPVQVTDISQRGIGYITGRDFNINEIYPLTIIMPAGDVIVTYGVIRFKREEKDTFRYGMELFIHPKDEERLAGYVMERELEIIRFLE